MVYSVSGVVYFDHWPHQGRSVGRWVGGSAGRWVGGSVGRWVGAYGRDRPRLNARETRHIHVSVRKMKPCPQPATPPFPHSLATSTHSFQWVGLLNPV